MNVEPPDLTCAEQRVKDYIQTLLIEIVRLNDHLAEVSARQRVEDRHEDSGEAP